MNYEFGLARNFTLAPFLSFHSYGSRYYHGNAKDGFKYYSYRETVVPIGAKGTYYFDELLRASSPWDFYLAGSLGFALIRTSWDNDYYGDRRAYRGASPLFLDLHIGTEYHISERIGVFLDLSTGVSTIGIAVH